MSIRLKMEQILLLGNDVVAHVLNLDVVELEGVHALVDYSQYDPRYGYDLARGSYQSCMELLNEIKKADDEAVVLMKTGKRDEICIMTITAKQPVEKALVGV